MKFTRIAAALLTLLTLSSQAQESRPWPPPRIVVPPSPQAPGKPMELREMEVRARIVGLHVETTTTLTFLNPNARVLEGELQFPLPDGAVVTGYTLDINGRMVDGVVVRKEAARVAFETEVRRGVDPGLVEHVAGNVYRTRIYPLPANGTRQIRLKYVAELPVDKKGDAAWHLPMPIGETVAKLAVRIEVVQGAVKPEIGGFGNLRFQSFENTWVAETAVKDAKPGEDLWVALPKLPAQVTALERTADGEVWFAVSDQYAPSAPAPKPPRKLGIAWDASGSRTRDQLPKELAALKSIGVEFALLVFRDRPEPLRALANPDELKNIPYDGGTDLAAAADVIRQSDIDQWLLFTDGFDTLSDRLPDFGGKNVTAVVSPTAVYRELLRQVCAQVIDLQRLDAGAILQAPVRVVRVNGTGLAEAQGIGAVAQGRVSVHGKLTAEETELRLEYSDGHRSPPVKLSKKTATEGALLASVWAAQRVTQLGVRADANADELLALGRRFGIVSPVTSLIVLENIDQYVRHDIEPPASLPEWRRQWADRKAAVAKEVQQKKTGKLDRVLALWKERVRWWEHEYKVPANFKYKGEDGQGHPFGGGGGAPAPPMPVAEVIGVVSEPATGDATLPSATGIFASRAAVGQANGLVMAGKSEEGQSTAATISVKPWDPATPYLKTIRSADKANRYVAYLDLRNQYTASPAFYLDCADLFLREGDAALGVRILTNLAEMKLEEASLLRVLAWRLQQAGQLDLAILILRKVQKLRPEEPQSHRDLALALAERGETSHAAADVTEAMKLLEKVVMGEWDGRFPQLEVIALEELNALVARTQTPAPASLDPRLLKNLDVDLRIAMVWDADLTDVDLHVVEPTGEEAAYNHNRTTMGGLVSADFTQGYGPEEYLLRRARPGPYKVFAHYYGSRQQTVIGACTITATVFTDFGRPTQKKQVLTLRLDKPHDRVPIGDIQFGGAVVPAGQPDDRAEGPAAFQAIRVGQRAEEVKAAVGEPQDKRLNRWTYRAGDRQYRVQFSDAGRVEAVVELLPGGAEMILTQ